MKNFKKTFLFLIAAVILTGLTGCADNNSEKIPAAITPESGGFGVQEGNYKDIEIILNPGSYTLKEIVLENAAVGPDGTPFSKVLQENTDYVKNGDTYIILKEFLETLSDYTQNVLVFKMDDGDNPVFKIHIVPDESGFSLDWMLMSLSPEDGIRTEEIANKISLTSEIGLEELINYYQGITELMQTAEIKPQYESDWWYAVKDGNFIYTIYLTAGETETNVIITFYLEEDQPK